MDDSCEDGDGGVQQHQEGSAGDAIPRRIPRSDRQRHRSVQAWLEEVFTAVFMLSVHSVISSEWKWWIK